MYVKLLWLTVSVPSLICSTLSTKCWTKLSFWTEYTFRWSKSVFSFKKVPLCLILRRHTIHIYSHTWLFDLHTDNENENADYTIPTKPTLARGTSSRASSKRKVPPILVGDRGGSGGGRSEPPDSARDSILDGIIDDDSPYGYDEVRMGYLLFLWRYKGYYSK